MKTLMQILKTRNPYARTLVFWLVTTLGSTSAIAAVNWSEVTQIPNGFIVKNPRVNSGAPFTATIQDEFTDIDSVCEYLGNKVSSRYSKKKLGGKCTGHKSDLKLIALDVKFDEKGPRNIKSRTMKGCREAEVIGSPVIKEIKCMVYSGK